MPAPPSPQPRCCCLHIQTCTHPHKDNLPSCWNIDQFDNSSCPDDIYCEPGSTGPVWYVLPTCMFHSRMHATRQHISTDQPLRCLDATNRHPHTPTACSGACLDGYTYNSKLQICVACEENERHIIDLFTPVFALGGTSAAVVFAAYSQRKRARRWFAKIDVGRFRRWRTAMMSRAVKATFSCGDTPGGAPVNVPGDAPGNAPRRCASGGSCRGSSGSACCHC